MAIEQKWPAVTPQLFTANGEQFGVIKVINVAGFKVKQKVSISAVGQNTIQLQVKRVIGPDTLIVGPFPTTQQNNTLTARTDLTAYTVAAGAYILAEEQDKAKLKPDDILQAVYRQEPGTTIGVEIDDQFGNPIDSVKDSNGINRLAVDGQFTAAVDVQVETQLTAKDNYPNTGDEHDSIRIGDGVNEVQITASTDNTVTGMNVNSINSLFSKPFNKLTVLTKNDDGDPLTIRSSHNGNPAQLMTITYDTDGDFTDVEVSNL